MLKIRDKHIYRNNYYFDWQNTKISDEKTSIIQD